MAKRTSISSDSIYILQTTADDVYNILLKDTLPVELVGKLSIEELTDLVTKLNEVLKQTNKVTVDPSKLRSRSRWSCFGGNRKRILLDTTESPTKRMNDVMKVLDDATGHIMERGLYWEPITDGVDLIPGHIAQLRVNKTAAEKYRLRCAINADRNSPIITSSTTARTSIIDVDFQARATGTILISDADRGMEFIADVAHRLNSSESATSIDYLRNKSFKAESDINRLEAEQFINDVHRQ